MNIYINVHSFVDLITNSSSESFVSCTEKTLETIKLVVNGLLGMNPDNKLTADELFTFKLEKETRYGDVISEMSKEEQEEYDDAENLVDQLVITPKDPNNKEALVIATKLNGLVGSLDTWAISNY